MTCDGSSRMTAGGIRAARWHIDQVENVMIANRNLVPDFQDSSVAQPQVDRFDPESGCSPLRLAKGSASPPFVNETECVFGHIFRV